MTDMAKFKFNFKTGEIEIEGTEDFVRQQIDGIDHLLNIFAISSNGNEDEVPPHGNGVQPNVTTAAAAAVDEADVPPATFGEWMHGFRAELSDIDKALITARFVQSQSASNDFKTSDVNKALQEHGIKLSNPSQSLKLLSTKKHLFQTRKVGKLRFMRVSFDGQKHLGTLKREN